jgi:hypothetical protein
MVNILELGDEGQFIVRRRLTPGLLFICRSFSLEPSKSAGRGQWLPGASFRRSRKHYLGRKKGYMVPLHIRSFALILLAFGTLALSPAAHASDRGNANTSDGAFSLYA